MIAREAAVPIDVERLRRRESEVRAHGILALLVEWHDALVVIEAAREEVARAARGAAIDGHVVVALDAVAKPRIHIEVLRAIALAESRAAAPRRVVGRVCGIHAEGTLTVESLTRLETPRRRADGTALREDLNHARG